MIPKSKFQELVFKFQHEWECPYCVTKNILIVSSPRAQMAKDNCSNCGTPWEIQLDLDGPQWMKKQLAPQLGNTILEALIPTLR